jgi:hypothetical protein
MISECIHLLVGSCLLLLLSSMQFRISLYEMQVHFILDQISLLCI